MKDEDISVGDEVLALNGRPTRHFQEKVYAYLSGESDYLKSTLMDQIAFPRMMWILETTPERYQVVTRDAQGQKKLLELPAVPAGAFEEQMALEQPVMQADRSLTFKGDVACMRPGQFMNAQGDGNTSKVETFDKGEFARFLEQSFAEIALRKARALVVDLRHNPGGSSTFSDELVRFFADKPFRFCSRFRVKTSAMTKAFWPDMNEPSLRDLREKILSHGDGEIFDGEIPFCEPVEASRRFTGKVVVLVDRYSYSQATCTAAMIQDYGLGTVVGEVTADVPSNYAAIHQFSLPRTGIAVSYPKAFLIRPNGDERFVGTVPDLVVAPYPGGGTDEIMDRALEYIRQETGVGIRSGAEAPAPPARGSLAPG